MDLNRSSMDQYQVPGGFPPSNSDRSLKTKAGPAAPPVASAVPKMDDEIDTEGESDSVYSDAAEDFDGDGFGSINAIVDSRSIPRSAPTSGTVSQSRDTTPRPVDRVAVVDGQPRNVPEPAPEEVRSSTPTQESVNRQVEDSPASPSHHRGFGGPYPPLPVKSKARNGAALSASSKQRPMSVGAHGIFWLAGLSAVGQRFHRSREGKSTARFAWSVCPKKWGPRAHAWISQRPSSN